MKKWISKKDYLKKFGPGGTTNPPIITYAPKDPRIQAYQDSLSKFNRINPSDRKSELERLNYNYQREQNEHGWNMELEHKPVQPYQYQEPINKYGFSAGAAKTIGTNIDDGVGIWNVTSNRQKFDAPTLQPRTQQLTSNQQEEIPTSIPTPWFTRGRQPGEKGPGLEYFDKKTGQRMDNGGINNKNMAKWIKKSEYEKTLKKAQLGTDNIPYNGINQDNKPFTGQTPGFNPDYMPYNSTPYPTMINPNMGIPQFNPNQDQGQDNQNKFNFGTYGFAGNRLGKGISELGIGALDTGFGAAQMFGNNKQTRQTNINETNAMYNQGNGSLRDPANTQPGYKGRTNGTIQNKYGGKIMQDGGNQLNTIQITNPYKPTDINDLKAPRSMANTEVEGGEVIQTPQGLSGIIHGPSHNDGGIPTNLPQDSKVFSEKLKFNFNGNKKKSYADMAKKYATEKEHEIIQSKDSDKIAQDTAKMNIQFKNQKLEELFKQQESNKLEGKHGDEVAQKAIEDYQGQGDNSKFTKKYGGITRKMSVGGFLPKLVDGAEHKDNNPSLAPNYLHYFDSLDSLYSAAQQKGYKGPKEIGQLQDFAIEKMPKETSDYLNMVPMTNKGRELFGKDSQFTYLSPQDKFKAFKDDKWDFRYPSLNNNQPQINNNQPNVQQPTQTYNPTNLEINKIQGNQQNNQGNGFNILPLPIGNNYGESPVSTSKLNPHLINFRPEDIQGQVNDVNRSSKASNRFLPTDSVGYANIHQTFGNQTNALQNIYGQEFNRNQSGRMGVDQFNARELSSVDQQNLAERNRFQDLIQRRRGIKDTQLRSDENASLQNYNDAQSYGATKDYIQNVFNPNKPFQYYGNNQTGTVYPGYGKEVEKRYMYDSNGKKIGEYDNTEGKKFGGKIGIKKKSILKKKK